jgi:hypothetical protein
LVVVVMVVHGCCGTESAVARGGAKVEAEAGTVVHFVVIAEVLPQGLLIILVVLQACCHPRRHRDLLSSDTLLSCHLCRTRSSERDEGRQEWGQAQGSRKATRT